MPSQWSQDKYVAALKYAGAAHLGQKVPGSELPYVVHVAMVAMEVIAALQIEGGVDGDLSVQCALLHDVIEDAGRSYEDLEKAFGKNVADGVLALTKSNMMKSKSEKMADSLARVKEQHREIGMVKLADRIVNLQPPPSHWSAEKRTKYHEEAIQIHEALKGSSPYLAERLSRKIHEYQSFISPSEDSEQCYPKVDRSGFKPNFKKRDEDDQLDLAMAEGTLKDGRPFRTECWAAHQITYLTFFMPSRGLENATVEELKKILIAEGLVEFDDEKFQFSGYDGINLSVNKRVDDSKTPIFEMTVIVGDEDGTYIKNGVKLRKYESWAQR